MQKRPLADLAVCGLSLATKRDIWSLGTKFAQQISKFYGFCLHCYYI